jgi:hypothetical protein
MNDGPRSSCGGALRNDICPQLKASVFGNAIAPGAGSQASVAHL